MRNKKITTSYLNNGFITPFKNMNILFKTYTLKDGIEEKYITYKKQDGSELNDWPMVLNEDGSAPIFYIEKGIELIVEFVDSKTGETLKKEYIKQLEGKDGGEPDLNWRPTEQDLEDWKGLKGFQGKSVVGPDGKGIKGLKGDPFYTQFKMLNNQTVTVPAGIKEIFITASAGGGSAANYSNSFFIYDVYNNNLTKVNQRLNYIYYKDTEESTTVKESKNSQYYKNRSFIAIHMLPGSGFAGQSVYRKKIRITDTTKDHTLQCFIGKGGQLKSDLSDRNGSNGENTKIYLDDKLVLELKGGLGGKQNMPMLSRDEIFRDADNLTFNENLGFNNGVMYWFLENRQFGIIDNAIDERANTPFTKMTYRVKNGTLYTEKEMYAQNRFHKRKIQFNYYSPIFPLKQLSDLNGQNNIFTSLYNTYSSKYARTPTDIKASRKKTDIETMRGFGEGGDCYFCTEYNNPKRFLFNLSGSFDCYIADYEEMVNMSMSLFNSFEPKSSDGVSYKPGIFSPVDWNTHFINLKDYIDTLAKDTDVKLIYKGPGFYYLNDLMGGTVIPARNVSDQQPDNGTDGCCFVEFGSIKEIVKS